ncbi:MAG TPA: ferritin [Symbiobacteriaceae bacterium]|nr:ferritin [Symbiobacteriaceae bacterium]
MISEQMQQLINHLISVELGSAYLYLAMANYFTRLNLMGMASWLRIQTDEERGHADRLLTFLADRGGVAEIRAIPAQPVNFGSPLEAWQKVLSHEQFVTQNYQQAYDMAMKAQDYQAAAIFQDFLREQVDETAQSMRVVGRLQLARDNTAALLMLDQELGQREAAAGAAAPAPAAGAAPAGGAAAGGAAAGG